MKIIYCGELKRTPDAPDHMGIVQGLQWLKNDGVISEYLIVDPILNERTRVIEECNQFGADVVIHGNTDSLSNNTIPFIKGKNVFFMGDLRTEYDEMNHWAENAKGLAHVFISNRDQIPLWSRAFNCPASFWPHGSFVPKTLVYDEKHDHNVVFIGGMNNSWPYNVRFELIEEIKRKLPTPLIHIDGRGTDGRNQVWRDMPAIYHSSKVVLDISHFWGFDGYASGRYWYSAGLGGCSVTKRFPGCEEFYADEKEKWYFDTVDECVELVTKLLADKELREQTKLAAYERNKKDHNYKVRFTELLHALQ